MRFIKLLIQRILPPRPKPESRSEPAVATACPPDLRPTSVLQAPQPPVRLPINQTPETLADAIQYVRMGEPADYSDLVKWHTICGELRNKYKADALSELKKLLNNISAGSLSATEVAIDTALLDLQLVAPVQWVLDRKYEKNHSDGSRSYRLIRHWAVINPNGAFAITDLDGVIWLDRASACGTAFVAPP